MEPELRALGAFWLTPERGLSPSGGCERTPAHPLIHPRAMPRGIGTNHIAIARPRGARFRHHRPLPQRSQISSPKTIFANPRSTARNGGKDGVGGLTGAATVWVTSWPAESTPELLGAAVMLCCRSVSGSTSGSTTP